MLKQSCYLLQQSTGWDFLPKVRRITRHTVFGTIAYSIVHAAPAVSFETAPSLIAQVVADPSVGTIVISAPQADQITGGTIVGGRNLFHSFSRFDIPNNKTVNFLNSFSIDNIFARVTGGAPSDIQGLIQTQGTANLFLMNPSGILFGKAAQLNVGGSFVATTANALQFPNGAVFSLTSPVQSNNSLLSVNPSAFLFNQVPIGNIVNNSIAVTGASTPSGIAILGLRVPDGKDLLLVGGNIHLNGGRLNALSGRIELGGLAQSGEIGLETGNNRFQLRVPSDALLANVDLTNDARIGVRGMGGGDIAIYANAFTASSGGRLTAGVDGQGNAGDITVNAKQITLSGIGASGVATGIYNGTLPNALGNAGKIVIYTDRLSIENGAVLNAITAGQGNAGDIIIHARDRVSIDGFNNEQIFTGISSSIANRGQGGNIEIITGALSIANQSAVVSGTYGIGNAGNITLQANNAINLTQGYVFSGIGAGGVGKGGNIQIQARSLSLTKDGQIASDINPAQDGFSAGQGSGGTINITVSDFVDIAGVGANGYSSGVYTNTRFGATGRGGDIQINAPALRVAEGGVISAQTQNTSDAGNITINANTLAAMSGGQVLTGTYATGQAGVIRINAKDAILINGSDPTFSDRFARFGDTVVFNVGSNSGIFANTTLASTGGGGEIIANTSHLNVTNGGEISAQSQGTGRAGNIAIGVNGSYTSQNGKITTSARSQEGGNISITAKSILLQGNSDIRTDLAQGQGNGGNITLSAGTIIALDDSDILAFAPQGQGGNITFKTNAFLSSPLYRSTKNTNLTDLNALDGNRRVDVNASGSVAGTVVGVPDIGFLQNSLTLLPQTLINPGTLLANSCIVRNRQGQGTFHISGSSSLPERPGDAAIASYPTGDIRLIAPAQIPKQLSSQHQEHAWRIGDPIVEPQGIYILPNHQLVLSRDCSRP